MNRLRGVVPGALSLALALVIISVPSRALAGDRQGPHEPSLDIVLLVDNSGTMEGLSRTVLGAFIDALGDYQRLAVVKVGEKAEVVHALSLAGTAAGKQSVIEALGTLDFMDDYADLQAGLELALKQLAARSSEDAIKIVVLISDGKIDKPAGWIMEEAFIKGLSDGVLADFFLYRITFYAIAWGEPDLPLMQEVAYAGAGRCMIAPNDAALGDALSIVSDRAEDLQPFVLASGGGAQPAGAALQNAPPVEAVAVLPGSFWVIIGLLLVINVVAMALVFVAVGRKKGAAASEQRPEAQAEDSPSLAQLRYRIEDIAGQLRAAGSDLSGLQVDLVSYGAERWERERDFLERYHHLTEHLFLLLDHLEVQVKGAVSPEGSRQLYRKANRILEEEGIEEISVMEGDPFDGKLHKHVGERPGDAPQGTILEVARKGYIIRHDITGEDEFVLRPAEVIVSTGPTREDVN